VEWPSASIGMSDVLDDLAAAGQARERIEQFFARAAAAGPVRTRGTAAGPGLSQRGEGLALLARCGADNQKRLGTLLDVEPTFPPRGDYGFLIGPACSIVESELERLLARPAKAIARSLADLAARWKDDRGADLLDRWAAG
jgi:hypothetical protein